MNRTTSLFRNLLQDESGQDLIEYALIASLVALGALASEKTVAARITTEFNTIGNSL